MSSAEWKSSPRAFRTSGFELLDPRVKIEEETLPTYTPEKYYPVRQGEIFNERYQTLAKVGYGVTSTVWLARDLCESTYVILKIYVSGQGREHELNVYTHIDCIETDHPGKKFVRKLFDHFYVDKCGLRHLCLVHQPLGVNTSDFLRLRNGRRVTLESMKSIIRQLLGALDFLHSVAGLIHTDIQLNNLLLPTPSPAALSAFEEQELHRPAPRKILGDRTIYTTSHLPAGDGLPLLSDLGEARFGDEDHSESIMPDYYRAPEVILKSNWDYKVDIWSVAMVAWDLVSPNTIIEGKVIDGIFDDGAHIAELVALLGPPPPEFLKKMDMSWVFWDESGNWKNLVPLPDRMFEKLVVNIQGEDVEGLLGWLRRALQWDPADRPTALELLMDPWLMKGLKLRKRPEDKPHDD
ncbi:U4/U6 small nuclear ribonucleoprotein PRP4 [Aspergillus aculeatinus CBS 121060]|uniref:U4/U6 small nuclear ribonucleo protein PRP4 n=1 Tax=Aspergillus aculeatinus CBS 121060 TaxID=1448322 RepID=A0ACD1HG94_9EURO|nr:U4/U6 small nuclear ribonucleo protein PRP4 [Aspergillus aculeatinus CBS 121060]RAH72515.1 U4/U6 small nuclear ribonucleo protein PRP4 [Aspergillus aculeatinus CBS 121060]